ncbi:MAG: hypothetical protein P9L97_03470 [Candidatus Tenebribacter davisii]|jgi:hypothetical protein|nr:hypothetical protein [Candidatus Tenebribacter davisii]
MKKVLLLLIPFLLIGCTKNLMMERSTLQTIIQLDKSQYDIVGDISGEASISYIWILFVPMPFGVENTFGSLEYPSRYSRFRSGVEQNAIYNAVTSVEGIDAIITPKFETETTGFPPLYWTTKVKVTGKGIRLITD